MADKIIVEYELVPKGGEKVVSVVQDITQEWEKSEEAMKAALSEKQIEGATEKLTTFNTQVEKTATGFSSAKAELRELEKVITSGKLQGKDLQQAVAQAAKLKDRIGDVRNEISRLASDTRLFDTFVEGGRAVAAAFSVAQGAAALFGEENKDLQKAILKTQGALALLTGAQELANIVTKQGGIATQAYGVAMRVVDGIAKVTGFSIAASMAVATAGVALLVAGVVALIAAFNDADDAAEELAAEEERRRRQGEIDTEAQKNKAKSLENEYERRRLLATTDKELAQTNIQIAKEQIEVEKEKQLSLSQTLSAFDEAAQKTKEYQLIYSVFLDSEKRELDLIKELNAEKEKLRKIEFEAAKQKAAAQKVDTIPTLEVNTLTIQPTTLEVLTPATPLQLELPVTLRTPEEKFREFVDRTVAYLEEAKPFVQGFSEFTASAFSFETARLEQEKAKQLAIVGDDAKKREEIERKFRIKQAEAARKQAALNKAFAVFDIILSTAQGIQKTIGLNGLPAAIPFIALAVASGALQLGAVLARPLPEIPKFKKGGAVPILGGTISNGKIYGRSHKQQGVLIEAEGGEFINNKESAAKYGQELEAANNFELHDLIYHKYLLPALKQAGAADKEGNLYDDWQLRREVKASRESDKENSKYIVSGILTGIRQQNYFNQRYYS